MLPITRMISEYNHYDYNNPKFLIVHFTGNAKDTAKNNAIYFGGGNRNASAHYFVDDNSIYQVVEDKKGAWHIGNSVTEPNNKNSIGIEMCCSGNYEVSEKTEANALELVKYLMNKYNISINNVRTHAEVTNYGKTCPNWNANNWQRWKNFKNKLNNKQTEVEKVSVINGEWRVKVLQDTNLWLDTHYSTVGGRVTKGQTLNVTQMTKDGQFFVVDGKYLVNSHKYNYVCNIWNKPLGKIQTKQDCNAWSYCNYDVVANRVKAWEIFEYIEKRNDMFHIPYIGWISASFVNKELKLTDALVTNRGE